MQAIVTKYFGPRNIRGSRIKATCDAGSVTVGYCHSLNFEANHKAAAAALCAKLGWTGDMVTGTIPSGEHVHVFKED